MRYSILVLYLELTLGETKNLDILWPVARSLVSANRWLRGIKTHRFPWYLTLVGTNHASSNPGLWSKRPSTTIAMYKNRCRYNAMHTQKVNSAWITLSM